jgi:hypothetical protein
VAWRLHKLIGHVFHELDDWRGMATNHDKTAWNFLARGPSHRRYELASMIRTAMI